MVFGKFLAIAIILIIIYYLVKSAETLYVIKFKKPIYTHFYLFKKKLPESSITILENQFEFYGLLNTSQKTFFQHRLATFLADKEFFGREDLEVTEEMKVLIGATAIMLTFGMRNYYLGILDRVIIYPNTYYSNITAAYHKGEFNPRLKALVISWKDFKEGYADTTDNLNLGIHEFMHAMQLEALQSRDIDSVRFQKQFQNILKSLTKQDVRDKLNKTRYFRNYAFTNQYEFMAVLAEYFIESPNDFKEHFPELYKHTKQLLNFTFAGY